MTERERRESASDGAGSKGRRRLEPALLGKIVRLIVEVAQPDRIILFGSAARERRGRTATSIF